MRIILSRKGFDSSAGSGGVPSPIFPDGRMLSLPIPDRNASVSYGSIRDANGDSIGPLVENLTAGRKRWIPSDWKAHIDPDLGWHSLDREGDWGPIFGQQGAAQSHLKNQGVCEGDVFVFFGLFREVELRDDGCRYVAGTRPKHVIFGWMQIGRMCSGEALRDSECFRYHSHVARTYSGANVVYIAGDRLVLNGHDIALGAGLFESYNPKLQLTAPDHNTSVWSLPMCFYPGDRASSLSYHGDISRWTVLADDVLLRSVGKGQEFVLDCDDYPGVCEWVEGLFDAVMG
jgi:hypothetical protein